MTVMYSFCFWFSVRLGSIIVGVCCLVQCILALIACGIGMEDLQRTSSNINYWLETNDMMITKYFFVAVRDDPETYLTAFIAVLTVYLCSCIMLIYGAFRCNIYLMFPFMLLDFLRLIILSVALVFMILLIKKNTVSLGYVIAGSILGGFILLYLWYQWFCTVALWQIIREINRLNASNNQTNQIVQPQPPADFKTKGNFENKIAVFPDYYHPSFGFYPNNKNYQEMPRPTM